MADSFDTNDMEKALTEATNQPTVSSVNEEAAKRAAEAGWTAPQPFDYNAYNTTPNATVEDRQAAEADLPAWAHNAEKYEWKEEYGDVGPPNEALEKQLFHSELQNKQGIKFELLREIPVTTETTVRPAPIKDFTQAGLHPVMVKNIELCGYEVPTPVQAYTIPSVITGNDIIAVAQTGSGKTAAYLIPVLSKLMGKAKKLAAPRPSLANGFDSSLDSVRAEPLVLIIAPTRELAMQIFDEARRLCYRSMLRPCVVYGGGPSREQRAELQRGCDILIGTPGRLIDFMGQPNVLSLNRVKFTIIDEADEMLHSDWEDDINKIFAGADTNDDADHRYLMFSATFNKGCRKLARKFLATDHVRVRIGRAGSAHQNVKQVVIACADENKKNCLYDLLMSMPPSRTLVFVNSKRTADYLDDFLFNKGLPSTYIHADRTQREREDALRGFREAKTPIMVATAVSARGLDIRNVMHVVNFDLPSTDHGGIDEYIHRIGRTARIGNEGLATSFFNEERDASLGPDLVKVLMETNQQFETFLDQYKPEGEDAGFGDDTDEEDDDDEANGQADGEDWGTGAGAGSGGDGDAGAGAAWGAGDTAPAAADNANDTW